MAGPDWDQENPYASPRSIGGSTGHPRVERHADLFAIEPSLPRRDWIDFGLDWLQAIEICLLFEIFSAAVFGLPALAAFFVFSPPWFAGIVALLCLLTYVVFTVSLIVALSWQPWAVSRLLIDASGIAFERRAGQPRFLRWSEIRFVRPATRREVFVHAWLWPWRWAREPSKTYSALGHYRIEWANGYLFFPPKDDVFFEEAVRQYCPGLLSAE